MAKRAELATVQVPEFELPREQPVVPPAEFELRIAAARERARERGLDMLLVYGDREHCANIAYLTDHDPRFEEALLVIPMDGEPALLLGNEGLGYAELVPIDVELKLFQGFSLPGQKRESTPQLEPVLAACGIGKGQRIGVAGWRYATAAETDNVAHWLEVPAFLVETLAEITGDRALVVNANDILMNPVDGLRTENSAAQLAVFEFAAAHCAAVVHRAILGARPGMTELEAVGAAGLNGMPLSAHLMFSTGERAHLGLSSPRGREMERGDPIFCGLGYRGGLTARGGWLAEDASELPGNVSDYLERLALPYFAMVAAWYEAVGTGVEGGVLQELVDGMLAAADLAAALNPGHLIHIEEWLHSPVNPGSEAQLRSGMLIQCDIIPVVAPEYHTVNAEDTIALADEQLRGEIRVEYPAMWARIEARREFMREALGIELRPEVLPFSGPPAVVRPFTLAPNRVLRVG